MTDRVCFLMHTGYDAFLLNSNVNRSGAEVQMALIAKYLFEVGYDIEIVCQHNTMSDKYIDHEYLVTTIPKYTFADTINLMNRYFFHIVKRPADIYITRMVTPLLPIYRFATYLVNKPLLFSSASQYDVMRKFSGKKLPRALIPFCRYALRSCDAVVAQSKWQKQMLEQNHAKESTVISNAIDLNYWKPSQIRKKKNLNVAWIGNIRPVKRFDRLIDIAKLCPSINFIAIGDKINDSGIDFQSLPNNLLWVGKKNKNEVKELLQNSSILINTSEAEGFPNTILEARGMGLYTLLFRVESLSTGFIDDDEYLGKFVDTCQEAADVIHKFFRSSNNWKMQSRDIILNWVQNYSIHIVGRKWVKLIRSVTNSHS